MYLTTGLTKTISGSSNYKYLILQFRFQADNYSTTLGVMPQDSYRSIYVSYTYQGSHSRLDIHRSGDTISFPYADVYIYLDRVFGTNDDTFYNQV